MQKVLITGAAGFLGKECIKQFQLSNFEVITTDRLGDVDILGDLSDTTFVKQLPSVDIVVNCAAVQYVTKYIPIFKRQVFFQRNNIDAAINLSNRYDNGTHFIHIGTSMMYTQNGADITEEGTTMKGNGVYSESKLNAQFYINKIPKSATVIPCIIGGPGREGLFKGFVFMMQKWRFVIFPGNGDHAIHMVHVNDVASLILTIAKTQSSGLFNAAAPNPLSIRGWIKEISDVLGIKKVRVISLPLRPIHLISFLFKYRLLAREQLLMLRHRHVLSIEKSLGIGWKPKYTNADIARDIALYITGRH